MFIRIQQLNTKYIIVNYVIKYINNKSDYTYSIENS